MSNKTYATISKKQLTRMMTIASNNGWTIGKEYKKVIAYVVGIPLSEVKTKLLSPNDYEQVVEILEIPYRDGEPIDYYLSFLSSDDGDWENLDEIKHDITPINETTTMLPKEEPEKGTIYPNLTAEQEIVVLELIDFVKERSITPEQRIRVVNGFAGTGKSYAIQTLVKYLLEHERQLQIVFAAPTHKALKVLKGYADSNGIRGVEFNTIYSLLGLKVEEVEGTSKIRQGGLFGDSTASIQAFDLIILDEASMVNGLVFRELEKNMSLYTNYKIIAMGDRDQLPPVNESLSAFFDDSYEQYFLTQPLRYSGKLGELVYEVRESIYNKEVKVYPEMNQVDIFSYTESGWLNTLKKISFQAYENGERNKVRALAYTNDRVNYLNKEIHSHLSIEDPTFMVGQVVIAQKPINKVEYRLQSSQINLLREDEGRRTSIIYSPYFTWAYGKDIQFSTSSEFKVLNKWDVRNGQFRGILYCLEPDMGPPCFHVAIHPKDEQKYILHLEEAANEAKENKRLWKKFYALKSLFAPLSPSYALTVHKSQGSSYYEVFVDMRNIERNRRVSERKKMEYVALSRAREKVHLLN